MVNSEGEVTAIAPGTVKITVTTDDGGFTAICTVNVEAPIIGVTGVTLNPHTTLLLVGNTLKLEVAVEPAEAANKTVTWSTSDAHIATINSAGEVTAVSPGTATITATADDGGLTAICRVTVTETDTYITMTTLASEVNIWIHITTSNGSDNFSIDWGDGNKSNIDNASSHSPWHDFDFDSYNFVHRYSGASEQCITIIGDNIEFLNCSGNSLTSLDVCRYSNLIALFCTNNQLTTLDFNPSLEVLLCHDNPLTALDLRNCTALAYLYVNDCALTTLDFSNCTSLTDIFCEGNQLTSLDVSNTALTTLSCSYNRLKPPY